MKNPCDECIVKVNCTQVCFNKINYKILLRNAVEQARGGKNLRVPVNSSLYKKYMTMLNDNIVEISKINLRRRNLQEQN